MTPPRNVSSDSEGTHSGHGAEEVHPDDPTNIQVESHHGEEAAKDRAVQKKQAEAAAKAQEEIARVIRETRERTAAAARPKETTSHTPSVSAAEARRALEQSVQIATAKLLEIAREEEARLKRVADHARRFAQAHLEEAQRIETENIFKTALD